MSIETGKDSAQEKHVSGEELEEEPKYWGDVFAAALVDYNLEEEAGSRLDHEDLEEDVERARDTLEDSMFPESYVTEISPEMSRTLLNEYGDIIQDSNFYSIDSRNREELRERSTERV